MYPQRRRRPIGPHGRVVGTGNLQGFVGVGGYPAAVAARRRAGRHGSGLPGVDSLGFLRLRPHPLLRDTGPIFIFLTTNRHGQGLGTDAVRTLAHWLIHERGHHRLTVDPAAANTAAIRSYRKVGFKPVGIMRAYGRDYRTGGWADGLLMDLLADELT
ncbi:hypothetical protein Sgleb_51310 [Streptomyces glebosus]|uniref:N-acetyltransferase domain-containing protein n=1 Tax=Streptomyces glebosus TaxID=249580 RepID=A0A640T1N2_9ACTN|nr:hypothetical protein Sgleb_51310 [Streptomyces glebosus]GHG53448.1 hypothetical protein GCM10010513_14250 [Streptomyces glebosus]